MVRWYSGISSRKESWPQGDSISLNETGTPALARWRWIAREWPGMKAQLQRVMHEDKALERAFIHANIPYLPETLGILPERYETAVTYAYLTRERFTFLDLAAMSGRRAG